MVILIVLLLGMSTATQASGPSDGGAGEDRGPLDSSEVWSDSFDDMGHVFMPDGGLVGVEVTGGEVRLKSGSTSGSRATAR